MLAFILVLIGLILIVTDVVTPVPIQLRIFGTKRQNINFLKQYIVTSSDLCWGPKNQVCL